MPLVIPYFINYRGCPHRCLFCNQHVITGTSHRTEADCGEELRQTVQRWLERSRKPAAAQLAFYGGSFTCLDGRQQRTLLEAAAKYLDSGLIGSIRLSTRPDCLSDDLCEMLVSYGVRTVELGVQSMSDRVLELSNRGHTAEQSRAAVRLLQRWGIEVGVQLMLGLPAETTSSFLRGVAEVAGLQPGFVRLYPTLVLADTPLARLHERGGYRPLSLNRALTLARTARNRLARCGVRVVRLGLQPSVELENRIVAGPYHPAFGECVSSRSWYLRARRLMRRIDPGRAVSLTISSRDYSAFAGPQRRNIKRLEQVTGCRITVVGDPSLERDVCRYAVS